MTDVWPVSLPQSLRGNDGHHGTGDPRLRSQTDAGPAKVRPRSSAMPDPLSGSMLMTAAQWAALQVFGRTTLLRWSLPFTFPNPDGGAALFVRFAVDLPTRSYIAPDLWAVALSLEVLP